MVLAAWLLVICGMTTLLIAANRKEEAHVCKDIMIGIRALGGQYYIEKEDVMKLIGNGARPGMRVSAINLAQLEHTLEANSWIRDAELYVDSRDVLHIAVSEREPIARVFTTGGSSFYMDSSGHRMPLLDKVSVRVPVFTGFTGTQLDEVKQVAVYVYGHPFWNAQIGQIDITSDGQFELIPVIGSHVIRIGHAEKIDKKLERLYVFYKQVMSRTGFDKYAAVDVSYDGQVVAVKKGPVSAVDSLQLQKNIEELINKTSLQNVDEAMLPEENIAKDTVAVKPAAQPINNPAPAVTTPPAADPKPALPAQATGPVHPTPKRTTPSKSPAKTNIPQKPKAVMKKRTVRNDY